MYNNKKELNNNMKGGESKMKELYNGISANGYMNNTLWEPHRLSLEDRAILRDDTLQPLTEYILELSEDVDIVVCLEGYYHHIFIKSEGFIDKRWTSQFVVSEILSEREYSKVIRIAKVMECYD